MGPEQVCPHYKELELSQVLSCLQPPKELILDLVSYMSDNIELLNARDFLPVLEKILVEANGAITLDTRLEALKTDLQS